LKTGLFSQLIVVTVITVLLASCTATRLVPEGKHLLHKSEISIQGKPEGFTKSNLSALESQKPNRSILGSRPQLWVYYKTVGKSNRRFWRWINENMGKPPVYANEAMAKNSAEQMSRYLVNVGYYNAQVSYSLTTERKLARLFFPVTPSWPYRINNIELNIPDTSLAATIKEVSQHSLIKEGDILNMYVLDNERDRITEYLRNIGYYYFSRDYIYFEVDTNLLKKEAKLILNVANQVNAQGVFGDSLNTRTHRRYFINRVNVHPATMPFTIQAFSASDTIRKEYRPSKNEPLSVYYFYFQGDPRIRTSIFPPLIQIKNNEPYSIQKVRQTYRALSHLRIYQATKISFDTMVDRSGLTDTTRNWLDCNISLQRAQSMSYGFDLEGTNSGGDLGVRGSLVFTHKNLFKGAEVFRFRINGGFEAQQIAAGLVDQSDQNIISIFNTTEIGADANILFPRFLSPITLRKFKREYQPKTNLNIGYSAQNRPSYSRTLSKASFGYDWMSSNTISHIFTPINLNSVKVNPSPEFQALLDDITNQRIKEQYSNYLVFGLKYSFIYNNQNINKLNDFFYFRVNFESSGNLLNLFNNTSFATNNGSYSELFGIRYAQFARTDIDFRYYRQLKKDTRLVLRTILGLGLPYGNSRDLPFERSFYAGGSNGMRGWTFRGLGPGEFQSNSIQIERIGDIQMEASAEYRFPIYSFLNGAFFADLGNIWTLKPVDYLPGGDFRLDSFYKQFGFDAGLGFRFDFSFFIFRLDAAVPLHDPSKSEGNRWVAGKLQLGDSNWQIGIGYPF